MAAAAAAARARGVRSMCGFNYRRVPAVALMRQLVAAGRLGAIRHVRAVYLQDWIVDPQFPLVWRLQRDRAGSGALGDIGAHIVDLTQYVTGQPITGVSALTETFVKRAAAAGRRRAGWPPRPATATRRHRAGHRRRRRAVPGPARRRRGGHLRGDPVRHRPQERRCGSRSTARSARSSSTWSASTSWSSTTPPGPAPSRASRRILVTEAEHPYMRPGGRPGTSSATSTPSPTRCATSSRRSPPAPTRTPSFADALQVQLVLDAVERSSRRTRRSRAAVDGRPASPSTHEEV